MELTFRLKIEGKVGLTAHDPQVQKMRVAACSLQFKNTTSTPIVNIVRDDLVDLDVLFKSASGTPLSILHGLGDTEP